VEPLGVELEADASTSVMAAAERAGYRWPTVCHGQGLCTTCYVRVQAHPEHLSEASKLEQEGIDRLAVMPTGDEVLRLACQARVEGDVTVFKRGVRLSS
jgi:2Fe-2S ferredoxin